MKSLITFCSMLLISISATSFNIKEDPDSLKLKCTDQVNEICKLVANLAFVNDIEPAKVEDVVVLELEEVVDIPIDVKTFLPQNFNPYKGIGDLDWESIELVELEEEVSFNFDTKKYLPQNFNPLKGLGDLDWNKIELIELEEEVIFDFDTKKYLPANFDPYQPYEGI